MKSYEEYCHDLQVKEINEDYVGTKENLQEFFMAMIMFEIDNGDYDIEEKIYNTKLLLELVENLYESGYEDTDNLIVKYNPMGSYYFEEYKEMEDTEFIERMKAMQKELNKGVK